MRIDMVFPECYRDIGNLSNNQCRNAIDHILYKYKNTDYNNTIYQSNHIPLDAVSAKGDPGQHTRII